MATSFFAGSSRLVPAGAVAVGVGLPPPGRVHCWLLVPPQVQICSRAPFAVLRSVTSRHLPEAVLTRAPPLAAVHFWAPVLLQSYSWILAPLVVDAAVTSRHLPSARIELSLLPTVHVWAAVPLQS